MAFDANEGTNKLANVLSKRIKREGKSPLVLDFGEIQSNGSLITNTFQVAIPKGEYSICRHVDISDNVVPRVLVAWVESEAVIIDMIVSS